uniref:non-specific serine/threonine protein kinase n=1 Tax=Cacopsylla melanoneura TaxID=428564 RepID=A0A8D8UKA2_9HEMI
MQPNITKLLVLPLLLLISGCWVQYLLAEDKTNVPATNTQLTPQNELHAKARLIISTLDGSLIGVDPLTGNVAWTLQDEPIVKVPVSPKAKKSITPLLLPDPKDGSLYLFADQRNSLKKLPFSIQQLVASSPCRSTDGIMYTGRKVDSWFLLDYMTGERQAMVSFNVSDEDRTCPISTSGNQEDRLFLGRTEYDLIMQDVKDTSRAWNVTFTDYASNPLSPEQMASYQFLHYADTSTGNFATVGVDGALWSANFGSPIVGVFSYEGEDLLSVPFTSVAEDAYLTLVNRESRDHAMLPTLYVGQHGHGMYAIPSLAGPADSPLMLLEDYSPPHSAEWKSQEEEEEEEQVELLPGYYHMPEYSTTRLQITGRVDPVIIPLPSNTTSSPNNNTLTHDLVVDGGKVEGVVRYVMSVDNIELKLVMAGLTVTMGAMFVYIMYQVRELRHQSSRSQSSSSSQSSTLSTNSRVTAVAEDLPDGKVRVGKITFDAAQVLGKGCEGTFVFKGEFDNRSVAVKRLLPECFTFADREVCLLRESDQHASVVRYYCTEQDKQFRYIALELCATTLQEYTEKGYLKDCISAKDALHQATNGLEHLHSLGIVHRDIKPHNVLLSLPSPEGKVRALISDFGLCKKLAKGKVSFSKRSGVTGTDGWIAPEMMTNSGRTMCNVDVFSLGCVFHFVLSGGRHPFGDTLRRQANILAGEYSLEPVTSELWTRLIEAMIAREPELRPSASTVAGHPAFWDNNTVLNFLQDVSDRIEKEELTDPVVLNLERGAHIVTRGDWRTCIDPEVACDLRKYRSYRGESCRDLLRAMRNKKHHYRELSPEAQRLLGSVPNEFVTYWLTKYPALVQHTWVSMQCIRHEPCLAKYFTKQTSFEFVKKGDTGTPKWIEDYIASTPTKKPPPSPRRSTGGGPEGGSVVGNIFNKPSNAATKTNKYAHWKNNKKAKQQQQQQRYFGNQKG